MEEPKPKKQRPTYGWVILALVFGNLAVEGGTRGCSAVFLPALRQGFGSSSAATAAVFSASGVVGGIVTPILGRILDKIGARYLFPIAGIIIMLGFLASSMVSDIWQLFIFYSILATLGTTTIGAFAATSVLAPWFPKSKGVMLGIADAGNPAGQAIFVPMSQLIVSNYGWRSSFRVLGITFFLLAAPLNFLFQRKPPGLATEQVRSNASSESAGPNFSETIENNQTSILDVQVYNPGLLWVLRQPAVCFLLLSRASGSISFQMTNLHIIAFFIVAGYGELQAAGAIGAAGLLGIGARPAFGILSDKIGREIAFSIGMGMTFLSILVVILFTDGANLWALMVFVALTGLSDGVSGLLLGAKAADIYPANVLGSVMGVVEIGRGIGWATGGILTGLMFDKYGDYTLAYSIAAVLVLLSIASACIVKLVQPKSVITQY
ncbi:MAG: MFS transporter [Chloroflexota bacterium]|nr:MFS transporter [Chloroflexota bacterium]